MEQFAFAYWWLVFPLMWFVFGMFGMWMSYRRQKDALEAMKSYAAQGKDPAEIARAMNGVAPDPYYGPWGGGWYGRAWRRGPYWEWRRTIVFGCLALGFWLAGQYAGWPGTERAFTLVAIIMGVMATGSLLFAIMTSVFRPKPPPNG